MKIQLSRRELMQAGIGLAATGLTRSLGAASGERGPHFFLQVVLPSGADSLYMFDARPLAFRATGLMANYADADPTIWEGTNGGRCLAAPGTDVLRPYKNRIAIINGVHMSQGFDGHDQNVNLLTSANPFGGNYFGPLVGAGDLPLSFLSLGSFTGAYIANKAGSLAMPPRVAPTLAEKAAQLSQTAGAEAPWRRLVAARAAACGAGAGMYSEGCRGFGTGLRSSQSLSQKLLQTKPSFGADDSDLLKGVKVASKYFTAGIADVCLLTDTSADFDTHAASDAVKSAELFAKVNADFAAVFEFLSTTPYDVARGLSMLDVTTVMIASEFSRTHLQPGSSVDNTGTDHNPQGNMILLAGKGIKGDTVIGATDLDMLQADGSFAQVSGAHLRIDSRLLKRMGKAYDFAAGAIVAELPPEYKPDHYITAASVLNTVLSGCGVPEKHWLTNDPSRQGGDKVPAKSIEKVLV